MIKFISCIIAFAIGFDLFFDATIVDILSFSLLITFVSYILGDRIILERMGNKTASVIDFLLVYMSVWIFGSFLFDNYLQIAWGSIISATLITGAEIFIHRYILNQLYERKEMDREKASFRPKLAFGTEVAKETFINKKSLKKKKE